MNKGRGGAWMGVGMEEEGEGGASLEAGRRR
jgi:hypothetical protein